LKKIAGFNLKSDLSSHSYIVVFVKRENTKGNSTIILFQFRLQFRSQFQIIIPINSDQYLKKTAMV